MGLGWFRVPFLVTVGCLGGPAPSDYCLVELSCTTWTMLRCSESLRVVLMSYSDISDIYICVCIYVYVYLRTHI